MPSVGRSAPLILGSSSRPISRSPPSFRPNTLPEYRVHPYSRYRANPRNGSTMVSVIQNANDLGSILSLNTSR
ncbi:MAG: hypothetical protein IKQ60_09900 [Candidatus Methanomethylophilaceae archaeon]|nr:hypothetical protein [Candidatus Methanomethylophilaceae archaeon]